MKTFSQRVRERRIQLGLSQIELAKKAGLSQSTVAQIELGRNSRSAHILSLAEALSVDPHWLADGTGSAERDAEKSAPLKPAVKGAAWPFPDISEEDVRGLPPAQLSALQGALALAIAQLKLGIKVAPPAPPRLSAARGVPYDTDSVPMAFPMDIAGVPAAPWEGGKTTLQMEREASKLKISRDGDVTPDDDAGYSANDHQFIKVKELDVRLAAGRLGIENYSETEIGEIMLRKSFLESFGLPLERMRIVYAHGDSMEPVIKNRAPMLFYEEAITDRRQIHPRVVYAINLGGDMVVKCLARQRGGPWLAKSINPEHPPFPLDLEDGREVRIVGRILWSPYDLRNGVDPRLL